MLSYICWPLSNSENVHISSRPSKTRHSFTPRLCINGPRHLLRAEIRAIIKESKTKPWPWAVLPTRWIFLLDTSSHGGQRGRLDMAKERARGCWGLSVKCLSRLDSHLVLVHKGACKRLMFRGAVSSRPMLWTKTKFRQEWSGEAWQHGVSVSHCSVH